jgi:integrase
LERARLWVKRLKGSLSVEHPIAGDELRAIRKYLASREDKLPWLFVSERMAPLTRYAVNYLIAAAGEKAGLGHCTHTCCVTAAAMPWPTRAPICAPCRIISAIEIRR